MKDGTYLIQANGTVIDYAERWSYGYIVGVENLFAERSELAPTLSMQDLASFADPGLIGVWYDTETGKLYVDRVKHVDALSDALDLARQLGELAIWDLREEKEIRL